MITELCIITLWFHQLQSRVLQLPYEIECPRVECAEGYTFNARYCGCFRPDDLPTDAPRDDTDANPNPTQIQLPYYYPGYPYIPQELLQQVNNQQFPSIQPVTPPGTNIPAVNPSISADPSPDNTQTVTNTTSNCNPELIRCGSERILDLDMCRCVCKQQHTCPLSFQVFNKISCQCEPQQCPNTCARCEIQNPSTCDCRSIISCTNGRILDHETCQCFCNTECNNELQKVNQHTCQCECTMFTTMVERVVHRVSRDESGDDINIELEGHRERRRTKKNKKKGKKGRKETSGQIDSNLQAEESTKKDKSAKKEKSAKEEKSRKTKGRSKSRSRINNQAAQSQQQPTPIPRVFPQRPPSPITETVSTEVKVFRCPMGKVPNPLTCVCN